MSLTVVCCKLLEHCVCNHILQHLEDHNLLTSLQHGFRRRHSCETQLLLTYDDLIGSFVRGIPTDMAILDFSHAFDTVPHERLLGKLASYGVGGILNDWVRSFLSGRTMTVVVDGDESAQPINVLSGVPQVTVLAPYYSLCILMTSLIKSPQVPSVDYLQMTAFYTGPYTHWRTNSSCSVILMHFRGGPSCGVCGSNWRSATSCTFAELSPPKCHIFMNYLTQCCFLWWTPSTLESGSQRTLAGECRLMLLAKRLTPSCTSSSGTSTAPPSDPESWLSRGLWDQA